MPRNYALVSEEQKRAGLRKIIFEVFTRREQSSFQSRSKSG